MKKTLFFLSLFFCSHVYGQDVFVMKGVPVYSQAETAVDAREMAILEGEKKAFVDLVNKIVVYDSELVLASQPENIRSFVRDVTLLNEKTTNTTCQGDLTVRFKADDVRAFLNGFGISYISKLPQSMLVVPVLEENGVLTPLNAQNPLYQALHQKKLDYPLFDYIVIRDNMEDLALLEQAYISGQLSAYQDLLEKYKAEQVLIVHVQKSGISYQYSTSVLPKGADVEAEVSFSLTDDRENMNSVMKDLLSDIFTSIQKKWLSLTILKEAPLVDYHINVPIYQIKDLVRIQNKIKELNFAQRVEIKGYSDNKLSVLIAFKGSDVDLADKLKLNGLVLTKDETSGDNSYLLEEIVEEKVETNQIMGSNNNLEGEFASEEMNETIDINDSPLIELEEAIVRDEAPVL